MPTCSKCEQDYNEVKAFVIEENKYTVYATEKKLGSPEIMYEFDSSDFVVEGSMREAKINCPHCDNVLATWNRDQGKSLDDVIMETLDVQAVE